jgi:hypothetical protein
MSHELETTMTNNAPAGGMVSKVNGQFYEGGEFMPTNGLYCGRVGAKRKKTVETYLNIGRVFGDESTATRVYIVERYAGFPYAAVAFANTAAEAVAIVVAAGVSGPLKAKEAA